MRSTIIDNQHLLGPFHNPDYKLQIGMEQSMIFLPDDQGPCYFTQDEREKQQFDKANSKENNRKLTKPKLTQLLKDYGMLDPPNTIKKLCYQFKNVGVNIEIKENCIDEGWVGKPKGSLQILFES